MEGTSWIMELRERLATPPPCRIASEGSRHAALVPLYVEAGQLWLLLRRTESANGGAAFPSAPLSNGDTVWEAARQAAEGVPGVDPGRLLELGLLDDIAAPTGEVLVPCVAVVPPPEEAAAQAACAGLPLIAARHPRLIEERAVDLGGGREAWVRIAHFGPVKMAGAGVEILEALLARLFAG